jgi:3-dehydroquinate dehydratase
MKPCKKFVLIKTEGEKNNSSHALKFSIAFQIDSLMILKYIHQSESVEQIIVNVSAVIFISHALTDMLVLCPAFMIGKECMLLAN